MSNTINSDLIRGNIDTIILRALYNGDRYGYDIINEIEQRSNGKYKLKQPTLYSCLSRLESQGFVQSYWGSKSIGGRRKYFTLTEMGRELFVKNKTDWEYSKSLIDNLITDDVDNGEADQLQDYTTYDENNNPYFERDDIDEAMKECAISQDMGNETFLSDNTFVKAETSDQSLRADGNEYTKEFLSMLTGEQSNNYTKKLENEQYAPDKNIFTDGYLRAENYFKDIDEEDIEEEEETSDRKEEDNRAPIICDEGSIVSDLLEISSSPNPFNALKEHVEPKNAVDSFLSYNNKAKPSKRLDAEKQGQSVNKDLLKIFEEKSAGIKKSADEDALNSEKPPVKDIHRIFEEKMAGIKKQEGASPYVPNLTDEQTAPKSSPEFFRKDQIQIRNFKRLQEAAAGMGDDIKIRSYEREAGKEFNEQFYYYSNKLKLRQYFILFTLVLIEVILCYVAINLGLRKTIYTTNYDLGIYIIAVLVGLSFPLAAFFLNWYNPNKRKRVTQSFRVHMIFNAIIAINLILIIYFLNVYFKMPLSLSEKYYASLFVPCVMCLNIPINSVIFHILRISKKFAV